MNIINALLGLFLASTTPINVSINDNNLYISEPNYASIGTNNIAITDIDSTTTQNANILAESTTTPIIATTTLKTKSKPKYDPIACSCVRTAIQAGLNIPLIDAKDLKPNSGPELGAGILFKYADKKHPKKPIFHIAVIVDFKEDGYLVYEGNFKKCKQDYRIVDYNDSHIIGFIK